MWYTLSGIEDFRQKKAKIIGDLRQIWGHFSGQPYIGASGVLATFHLVQLRMTRCSARYLGSRLPRSIRLHVLSSTSPFFSFLTVTVSHQHQTDYRLLLTTMTTCRLYLRLRHAHHFPFRVFSSKERHVNHRVQPAWEGSFGSSRWVFHRVETLPRVT